MLKGIDDPQLEGYTSKLLFIYIDVELELAPSITVCLVSQ